MFNKAETHNNFLIFIQFLKRDFYINRNRIVRFIINYAFIHPVLFMFSFGYILPTIGGFTTVDTGSLDMFVGVIVWGLLSLSFQMIVDLVFDLNGECFVGYQATILPPWLLIVEKIIFSSILIFLVLIPYYPVSFILFGYAELLLKISWFKLFLILYMGSLFAASYQHCMATYVSGMDQMGTIWMRITNVLVTFGGEFVPYAIVLTIYPILGRFLFLNPFLYVTEGVRSALFGTEKLFTYNLSILGCLIFSLFFIFLAIHFFKKKIDHI